MAISEIWTLRRESDGVEKTLAAWGIASARLTRRTQRSDSLEVTLGGGRVDDEELFAYGSQITLKRSGTAYFLGVATSTPRMARPKAEGVGYTFEGPWWWLEALSYQQGWRFLNHETLQQVSNLILSVGDDGSLITTGAQITDALAQAIADGAPFQIGTIDPAIQVPPEAGRDLKDAEVVRRMLRWHPDVVGYIDYTTAPPTLHLRARANLDAVSFSIEGRPHTGIDVRARPDLQVPVVVLKYQILSQVDGNDESFVTVDKYPAEATEFQPGAVIMTIDLQGNRVTYMKQYIKTQPIDPTSLAWWKERLPHLNDANISNLAIIADSATATPILADGGAANGSDPGSVQSSDDEDATIYANNLVEGEMPEWLTSGHAQMALVAAKVSYDVDMGGGVVEHHDNELVLVKVLTTDLATGWFRQISGYYEGETQPTGLAEAYYNSLAQLHYEGTFEISEQECGTLANRYLGKVLNLTDGLAEWATMRAVIFETTEDLATGKTRLRFGPAAYLSPKDWIDLMRQNRERVLGDRAGRISGILTTASNPVGGSGKHDRGAVGGGGKDPPKFIATVGGKTVTITPATLDSVSLPSNLNAKWRLISVCVDDGAGGRVFKSALALMTEPF